MVPVCSTEQSHSVNVAPLLIVIMALLAAPVKVWPLRHRVTSLSMVILLVKVTS